MTTSASTEKQKKSVLSGLKNPNAYVIIFILILLATLATWIIPSGQYERIKDVASGKTIVVPESFTYIEDVSVGIFGMLQAIPKGIKASAGIIAFVFVISGAIQIIRGTGALDAGIIRLIKKLEGKDTILIVTITFLFSLLGAAFGFAEETIPFIPLGVAMAVALGYDRIVGFDMVRTAAWVGFAGAFLNPFTIGVAQSIAELPLFSGIVYRLICFGVFFLISTVFILRYAKKIKKDPTQSLLYGYEGERDKKDFELDYGNNEFTFRHKLVLFIFLANMVLLVFGVIKFEWYTTELSALFLGCGIVAGIAGGLSVNEIGKQFSKGMAGVTFGALIIGFARAVVVILNEGVILDTIIHGLSGPLMNVSSSLSIAGMFLIQSLVNFFIGSGSGQAAATMPIMIPLSDVIGVTRQSTVLAFQFGDGITNMLWPAMIYYLAFADIPYSIWLKHIFKFVLLLTAIAIVLVSISTMINFGPF